MQVSGKRRIRQDRPAGFGARQWHAGLHLHLAEMLPLASSCACNCPALHAQTVASRSIPAADPVSPFTTQSPLSRCTCELAVQVLIRCRVPCTADTHGIECMHEIGCIGPDLCCCMFTARTLRPLKCPALCQRCGVHCSAGNLDLAASESRIRCTELEGIPCKRQRHSLQQVKRQYTLRGQLIDFAAPLHGFASPARDRSSRRSFSASDLRMLPDPGRCGPMQSRCDVPCCPATRCWLPEYSARRYPDNPSYPDSFASRLMPDRRCHPVLRCAARRVALRFLPRAENCSLGCARLPDSSACPASWPPSPFPSCARVGRIQ